MQDSKKSKRAYNDFEFRRRYDQLLRFRLVDAKPEEVIEIAKELGFNFGSQYLGNNKKKKKKESLKGNKTTFSRFNHFKNIARIWLKQIS